ncbi:MAG: CapA family protein [Candidatus Hodarchaeota archaeon]
MEFVKLSAVGDIFLGEEISKAIKHKNFEQPFAFVIDELNKSDLIFGNLESPLSNLGKPLKNKCCLYSPVETLNSLELAGFNIVSLANNHIFDYGYVSFEKTIQLLESKGISWFGAGKNLKEAKKPAIKFLNNISIGFLGYAWNFIESVNASKNKFGTAPLNKKIIKDVKNLKEKVDIVIVSLHWGYEREKYPLPSQRELAHKIIDAGASLILGHHSHVLQGVESYGSGVIVYSLGNFIFPDVSYEDYTLIQKPENKKSMIFECWISRKGIEKFRLSPIIVNSNLQPNFNNNRDILREIENLSEGFKARDYTAFWQRNRIRKDIPDVYKNRFSLYYYQFIKKIISMIRIIFKNRTFSQIITKK